MTFCDSPLVDECGVDIELPGRRGIIVCSLSSFAEKSGAVAHGFTNRIIGIVSLERYRCLHLIFCLESDLNDSLTTKVMRIQNICAGLRCETQLRIRVSSFLGLSCCIAQSILRSMTHEEMSQLQQMVACASDKEIAERAMFLIHLLPTICTMDALQCAAGNRGRSSAEQFQLILSSKMEREKMLESLASSKSMMQLSHILGASLNIAA